jgi:hypothetical protein
MASRLYEDIVSQRGSLENIVAKIPGFKGYHEKQARRKADRLVREQLAKDIQHIIQQFTRLENKLLDGGGLAHMTRTREVKSQIQALRDKIQTAAPKYSGMFASIKIGNEELDRIYAFDEAMFRFVFELQTAIDEFEAAVKSGEGIGEALDKVDEVAQKATDAFDLRDDEILRISDRHI